MGKSKLAGHSSDVETSLSTSLIQKSNCNQQFQLNEAQVQKMMATLKNGNWLLPMLVHVEGNHYGCNDGIHRLEA